MRGASGASLAAAQEKCEPLYAALNSHITGPGSDSAADAAAAASTVSTGTSAASSGIAGTSIGSADTGSTSPMDSAQWGSQLFALVDALDASPALLRSMADPCVPGKVKAQALDALSQGRLDPQVTATAQAMAQMAWSMDTDLPEGMERLAQDAILAQAHARGSLQRIAEELQILIRSLTGQSLARRLLSDPSSPADGRALFVRQVLGQGCDPATVQLAVRSTVALRSMRYITRLRDLEVAIAKRRGRRIADVTSAVPMTAAQVDRLERALSPQGQVPAQVRITVDPGIVGGLRIRMGSQVIDSTLASALGNIRRRISA